MLIFFRKNKKIHSPCLVSIVHLAYVVVSFLFFFVCLFGFFFCWGGGFRCLSHLSVAKIDEIGQMDNKNQAR